MTQITKHQLVSLLFQADSKPITLASLNGRKAIHGIVTAIEREAGSGSSFNVSLRLPNGGIETIYLRTID